MEWAVRRLAILLVALGAVAALPIVEQPMVLDEGANANMSVEDQLEARGQQIAQALAFRQAALLEQKKEQNHELGDAAEPEANKGSRKPTRHAGKVVSSHEGSMRKSSSGTAGSSIAVKDDPTDGNAPAESRRHDVTNNAHGSARTTETRRQKPTSMLSTKKATGVKAHDKPVGQAQSVAQGNVGTRTETAGMLPRANRGAKAAMSNAQRMDSAAAMGMSHALGLAQERMSMIDEAAEKELKKTRFEGQSTKTQELAALDRAQKVHADLAKVFHALHASPSSSTQLGDSWGTDASATKQQANPTEKTSQEHGFHKAAVALSGSAPHGHKEFKRRQADDALNRLYNTERVAATALSKVAGDAEAGVVFERTAATSASKVKKDAAHLLHSGALANQRSIVNHLALQANKVAPFDKANSQVQKRIQQLRGSEMKREQMEGEVTSENSIATDQMKTQLGNLRLTKSVAKEAKDLMALVHDRVGAEMELGEASGMSIDCNFLQHEAAKTECYKKLALTMLQRANSIESGHNANNAADEAADSLLEADLGETKQKAEPDALSVCDSLSDQKEKTNCYKKAAQMQLEKANDIAHNEGHAVAAAQTLQEQALQKEFTLNQQALQKQHPKPGTTTQSQSASVSHTSHSRPNQSHAPKSAKQHEAPRSMHAVSSVEKHVENGSNGGHVSRKPTGGKKAVAKINRVAATPAKSTAMDPLKTAFGTSPPVTLENFQSKAQKSMPPQKSATGAHREKKFEQTMLTRLQLMEVQNKKVIESEKNAVAQWATSKNTQETGNSMRLGASF